MEPKKRMTQDKTEDKRGGQVVPMRTYQVRTAEAFAQVLQREAAVGNGRAIVHMTINKPLAEQILERCNVGNRPLRRPNVERYATAMASGRWGDSTLMFGLIDGALRIGDAQHRLHALIASCTEQAFDVRVYTDPDEFAAAARRCDERGAARTLRDLLVIEGVADAGHGQRMEPAANYMMKFDGSWGKQAPDNETRMDYALRKIRSLSWAATLPRGAFRPHVLGALTFCHVKDARSAEGFAAMVVAGEGLAKGMPAHTLLQLKEGLNLASGEADKRRAMATVIRIFDDFRNGRKTKSRVEIMCDLTQAAVERVVNRRAWEALEAISKRAARA